MFTIQEYVQCLGAIHLTPKQREMLQAQYAAPFRTVTAPQLAKAVSYPNHKVVNLHYGKLGRIVAEYLWDSPNNAIRNGNWWFRALSSGKPSPSGYLWTMHQALAEALEELGIVEGTEVSLTEEIMTPAALPEGAVRRVTVNAYERNRVARSRCIAYYGANCFVCGFNFGSRYGELLEGFIHVHHLRQLSDIAAEYEVDPIADLRPVCPNCHAVIHRCNPPHSIDEVKRMLAHRERDNGKLIH
ncbi:HNH endonuclease [Nitrolancea hollandica]|uniref:HNH endonuclease n=1 Tax=Nitrolancea hollandica Lb TaxID=1129897 RepID=I4EKD1_9BACT|nr:HNH endonuclease [Nitrolancea hollandica]CCF85143.1 conserved hypothetical protein [Nitrolancea hollandica Lb]